MKSYDCEHFGLLSVKKKKKKKRNIYDNYDENIDAEYDYDDAKRLMIMMVVMVIIITI